MARPVPGLFQGTFVDTTKPSFIARIREYAGPVVEPMVEVLRSVERKYYYIGLFALLAAACLTLSYVFYTRYDSIQRINDYSVNQYDMIRQQRILLADILDMETGTRGYLLTGDERFMEPYRIATGKLPEEIRLLRSLSRDNRVELERLDGLERKIKALQEYLEAGISFRKQYPNAVISVAYYEKQKLMMDDIRQSLEGANLTILNDVRTKVGEAQFKRNDLFLNVIIGNVLIIGLMLVAIITIYRLESDYEVARNKADQSEKLYRRVMEGVNDGVYEFNLATQSLYVSPTYKEMLGYGPDEIEFDLKSFRDLIHPDDLQDALIVTDEYVTGKTDKYVNIFRMLHQSGVYIWVMSRGIALKDADGKVTTILGTHSDITEQKVREEQMNQLNADLETFTYITSHDMRAPLVNLKGFSKELQLSLTDLREILERNRDRIDAADYKQIERAFDADIPESLNFIGFSVERMDSLTKAILDLSRIGKYEYHFEPVNVRAIVDKCLGAQAYQIGQKGIEVTVNTLADSITDALALEQVFGNLIDNAIKYTRPNQTGQITIGCVETLSDRIYSVADNGRGIHPMDQQKIFEIFRRARNTGDIQGQGLGMAYVKAAVRKLGGNIWLTSRLDEGTTFYVRIPKTPPKAKTGQMLKDVSIAASA